MKKFYIETFGCQMNAHDSEKVIGTLISRGYSQVEAPAEADLLLYNTCSIRDKAEQKVFHRLDQFKREHAGKTFAVLGCVAQQEGEKIFERAPHVSMVVGSASYNRLPELLVKIESGEKRVTGLSLDTEDTFDTPLTRRDNPHRAYLTIIEGCDKSCAYCVVPFTRGPERSRTSKAYCMKRASLLQRATRTCSFWVKTSTATAILRPPVRFRAAASGRRAGRWHPPGPVHHFSPTDFVKDIIDAIDEHPTLCDHVHLPVQSGSSRVLESMRRLYTRDEYMRRIEWMKSAKRDIAISTDIIVGFPGETEADFQATLDLLDEVEYDSVFAFKYSKRPNTHALALDDQCRRREVAALGDRQERQRAIQIRRNAKYVGEIYEVMAEGFNKATGQWIGRTSQNKTLNFHHLRAGTFWPIPAGGGDTCRRELSGRRVGVRAVDWD
jgi:tRNA-2-methylthio-N6-dimethylallyladenosine synthase